MRHKSTEAQRKLAEYAESNLHLSYKELAEKLGCSQQTVSRACLKFGVRRKRGPLTEADLAKLAEPAATRTNAAGIHLHGEFAPNLNGRNLPLTTDEEDYEHEKAADAAEANDAR
jgi:transcriptional regulator with XRE-family HTH domain